MSASLKTAMKALIAIALVTVAIAQSPEPPLSDNRLTIHTLVREDIFAGLLTDNMERLTRGENSIEQLLQSRPGAKSDLLAWKGSATLYRAVRAYENKNKEEFQKYYGKAMELFSEARKIAPEGDGVSAVTGGTYVVLADRLPKEHHASSWSQAYDNFKLLWKHQEPMVDRLPTHIKGELLGGLAQSAQRTGRTEEMNQYVDKILKTLPNTPYESVAKQWKANPKAAADNSITCLTCHDAGRLSSRLASLNGK